MFSLQRPSAPVICIIIATRSVIIFCRIAAMIHNMVPTHTMHVFKLYCYFCVRHKVYIFFFSRKKSIKFYNRQIIVCFNSLFQSTSVIVYQYLPPILLQLYDISAPPHPPLPPCFSPPLISYNDL